MGMPAADMPAVLLRSRAESRKEIDRHPMEEIARGTLARMVRIALSDPDKLLWPYSILVDNRTFAGDAILQLEKYS